MFDSCFLNSKCKRYPTCPEDFCIKWYKIKQLYLNSLLTEDQSKFIPFRVDKDGTDKDKYEYLKEIENNILKFVENGENIYIYSSICGNGKTGWALRLLNSYIQNIWYRSDDTCKALFIHVPKFFIGLKQSIDNKNDYIDFINKNYLYADIVVWDELALKSLTPFEHEHLLNMINDRVINKKSNIYTSNFYPSELRQVVGERLYSRVINLSHLIELHGKDKRSLSILKS